MTKYGALTFSNFFLKLDILNSHFPRLTPSLADVFVITRHQRVDLQEFRGLVKTMSQVLAQEPGFLELRMGRSPDDVTTLVVVQRWDSIGNARRAINSSKNRMDVWPVMSSAQDEPTMFETLLEFKNGSAYEYDSVLNQD